MRAPALPTYSALALVTALTLAPIPALAQQDDDEEELIVDPLNDATRADAPDGDEERTVDPLEPAAPGDDDDDDEAIVDPLNPAAPGDDGDDDDDDDEELIVDPLSRTPGADTGDDEAIVDPLSRTPGADTGDDDEELIVDPLSSTPRGGGDGGDDDEGEAIADPLQRPSAATPRAATPRLGYFKGRLGTRLASDLVYDNPHEDVFEWRNALTLGVRFDATETLTVVLEGRAIHWFTAERGDETRDETFYDDTDGVFDLELREGFLRWSPDALTLTVGNQFALWGVMDIVSPAQLVHPRDLRQGVSAQGTEGLVPVFAADLRWFATDWLTLETLLVPFYTAPRGQFLGHDLSLLAPGSSLAVALSFAETLDVLVDDGVGAALDASATQLGTPDAVPENFTGGARLSASLGGVDLALGYFLGWDPMPMLTLDPDLAVLVDAVLANPELVRTLDPSPLLDDPAIALAVLGLRAKLAAGTAPEDLAEADYRRNHQFELDAVTYLGPIGLRSEVVFAPARTVLVAQGGGEGLATGGGATFRTRRLPVLDAVLGVSWESSDTRWVVISEGFYRATFGLESDEQPLAGDRHSGGVALALQARPLDELDLSLGSVWNASAPHDLVVTARLAWAVLPALETFVETVVFEGADLEDDLTLAGLYDHADELALGLEWTF